MNVVFDLDGTLADTEQLVREAYEQAGVTMPNDAWGLPAREWLTNIAKKEGRSYAEVHRDKNLAYHALLALRGVRRLPAATLCLQLHREGYDVGILTGASHPAAMDVRAAINLGHVPILGAGSSTDAKISALRGLEDGVYFDDNLHACHQVSEQTNWKVLYVTELDTVSALRERFEEAIATCTQ